MSATETSPQSDRDATAIRPFEVRFPEADLDDLRRRVRATRWPERETVSGDSQGVPLALMQELADYWATGHVIHYNRLDRGGHFAAWEQPQLFSDDIRASFRSLR